MARRKTDEEKLLANLLLLPFYNWFTIRTPKYDQKLTYDRMLPMIQMFIRNGECFELSTDYKMIRRYKLYEEPTIEFWHEGVFISEPLKFKLPS